MDNAGAIRAKTRIIPIPEDEFEVLEDQLLPPVNEFKRFIRVFFARKIVIFGAALLGLMILTAILADVVAPYGPYAQDLKNVLAGPTGAHILGTDSLGRDLFSRIIHGTRVALLVGFFSVIVGASVGTVIGLIAGFSEGILQTLLMRATDAIMAIPSLVLSLLIVGALKNGIPAVVIAVAVSMFPGYIRMVNGQVLSVKQNDYIMAEKAMGASWGRIIFQHILPNCMSPIIVMMTMMMGTSIMAEAGMSFLGIGITPPIAAWGAMCYDGYKYLMTNPLLSIAPGFAIMLLVFSFNMVGDGLRDALDPRLRGTLSE
ncbi:MAG: ABC transporter permease [Peptococcaceae bacterium]|jgi:ABC-type dipeptide/oligopeptide/nickel transport system permease subunit|nr:ABC transporter permease [Peptococcaceae bacterium]